MFDSVLVNNAQKNLNESLLVSGSTLQVDGGKTDMEVLSPMVDVLVRNRGKKSSGVIKPFEYDNVKSRIVEKYGSSGDKVIVEVNSHMELAHTFNNL